MLKARTRLRRKEFEAYFATGRRFHSPSLMLVHAPLSEVRASAVAPKKVFKTAVLRNRFRRRVYDIVGRYMREGALKPGVYIYIAKSGATQLTHALLKDEITALISKIR